MTSQQARAAIGSSVVERGVVADVGVIREVQQTYWQDHEQQRPIWMVKVEYVGTHRWVPLTAVRPAKPSDAKTTPKVRPGVPHQDFMARVASLLMSGPPTMEDSPNRRYAVDEAAAGLFSLTFGRLPTAAELDFMTGDDPGRCDRCKTSKRRRFLPDGTFGDECGCTDALNRAFTQENP